MVRSGRAPLGRAARDSSSPPSDVLAFAPYEVASSAARTTRLAFGGRSRVVRSADDTTRGTCRNSATRHLTMVDTLHRRSKKKLGPRPTRSRNHKLRNGDPPHAGISKARLNICVPASTSPDASRSIPANSTTSTALLPLGRSATKCESRGRNSSTNLNPAAICPVSKATSSAWCTSRGSFSVVVARASVTASTP